MEFTKKDLATSLTSTIFLVIAISGVMLYFHLFSSNVKELHEILGLAFVAVVFFHILFNGKSMIKYFSKKVFFGSLLTVMIVSSAFVIGSLSQSKTDPKKDIINGVLQADLKSSLTLLKIDYLKAKENLAKKGIEIEKFNSISQISKEAKKSPFEIFIWIKG